MNFLSRGAHAEVWALSNKLVAKVFPLGDPQARREYEVLKRATDLLPRVVELKCSADYEHELLVMERLEVLERRNFSHPQREAMLSRFEKELAQLHAAGWAHGDLRRTSAQGGVWDNVIWTRDRIRLIDAGNAALAGEPLFEALVAQDRADFECLRTWAMQD